MLMHGEINVLFGAYRRSDYGHCTVYTYIGTLPYFSTNAHVSTVIHVTLTIP